MKAMRVGLVLIATLGLVMAAHLNVAAEDERTVTDSATETTIEIEAPAEVVVVTYFHGDKRCTTCRKLEAYSREAIEQGFQEGLTAGTMEWRTVNYDREENKHYIEDYKLYTKALILSRLVDGEEVAWKNLDQIWAKVGDKAEYIDYVRSETTAFLEAESETETED